MELEALKTAGKVAGVGGLALMVFLFIFRALLKKDIFPKLTQAQAFRTVRMLMILTALVTLSGLAAWAFAGRSGAAAAPKRVLRVSLSEVENDRDGTQLRAQDFREDAAHGVSAATIERAAKWVVEELERAGRLPKRDAVTATVRVPADLDAGTISIELSPPVPFKTYLWERGGGGGKVRTEVDLATKPWKNSRQPRGIELRPDGYESVQIEVDFASRREAESTKTIDCPRHRPAVAATDGDASQSPAADRLVTALQSESKIVVVSKEQLAARREAIGAATTGDSPAAQISLRARLGYDFLATCTVREDAGD